MATIKSYKNDHINISAVSHISLLEYVSSFILQNYHKNVLTQTRRKSINYIKKYYFCFFRHLLRNHDGHAYKFH